MSWTFTTSGAAIAKAGYGANAVVILNSTILNKWCEQAEGALATNTRYDWVANSGAIGTNFKPILDDTISDMIAMKIINYDMGGYTSRSEAQTMLDVLNDNKNKNIAVLKEEKSKEKMI